MKTHKTHGTQETTERVEKTYPCPHCDASYARPKYLQKHVEKKHGAGSSAKNIQIDNEMNGNEDS